MVYVVAYRYCQPPNDFLSWFSPYLEDEEVIVAFPPLSLYISSRRLILKQVEVLLSVLVQCVA